MISPKICHCIHPFFREYAPVSTPSSYCIRYSVIKRYSVIVLYKMHIVQCDTFAKQKVSLEVGLRSVWPKAHSVFQTLSLRILLELKLK